MYHNSVKSMNGEKKDITYRFNSADFSCVVVSVFFLTGTKCWLTVCLGLAGKFHVLVGLRFSTIFYV